MQIGTDKKKRPRRENGSVLLDVLRNSKLKKSKKDTMEYTLMSNALIEAHKISKLTFLSSMTGSKLTYSNSSKMG